MVPFGPRLDFMTSCIPRAAEMLMARASEALATSAFGFSKLTAAIVNIYLKVRKENREKRLVFSQKETPVVKSVIVFTEMLLIVY